MDVEALGQIGIYLFGLVGMRGYAVEILNVSDLHLPNVVYVLRSVTYESGFLLFFTMGRVLSLKFQQVVVYQLTLLI